MVRPLVHGTPIKINMLLRSLYDLLPCNTCQLAQLEAESSESRVCAWCGKSGSLEHDLAGCEQSLYLSALGGAQHNQVLEVLPSAVESQRQSKGSESSNEGI